MSASPFARAAPALARRGKPVFPIKPRGKTPLTPHGFADATTDLQQIDAWIDQFPGANIAMPTGEPSGQIVLDVDGAEGLESLSRLESEHGPIDTLRVRTGRGGQHFYFKHLGQKIGNRARLAPGLDVRGDGGYVVVPPSVHENGNAYRWENKGTSIAELPDWLLALISKKHDAAPVPVPARGNGHHGYAEAALRSEIERVRTSAYGTRNDNLNIAAFNLGQLVGAGELDRTTVESELEAAAQQTGLTQDDGLSSVRKTIASGLNDGLQHPRAIPERARTNGSGEKRSDDQALAEPGSEYLPLDQIMAAFGRGETGDAELLASLFKDCIAYDHAEGEWYLFRVQWEPDRKASVGALVANDVAAQYLFAAAEVRRGIQADESEESKARKEKTIKDLYARANALRFRNRINNVLALAGSQPALALTGGEWDADPLLLGVANGTVDLRAGELRASDPHDYIRSACPVEWYGLYASAPRFEKFLCEIFAGVVLLIDFVQRLLGYGITGYASEHVLPVLHGLGRNGKDTLLEAIAHVVGDLAAPVSADVLIDNKRNPNNATPHLYALRGRRLAWVSETNEGAQLNAGQVKMITGGSRITARPLYGKPVTFKPQHLLMLVTNHKPQVDADDYAMWKRLLLIPFTEAFVDGPRAANEHERDPHVAEQLRAEAPGILAWLVRGCLAWQAESLNPPPVVLDATGEYQTEVDTIAQFIDEKCYIGEHAEARAADLYQAYSSWAKSGNLKALSSTAFGRRLGKKFASRSSHGKIYEGIGLVMQEALPENGE